MRYHRQCKLQKENTFQTSWIPEKFAKVGNYVNLKESKGWKVIEVHTKMRTRRVMEIANRFHRGLFASLKRKRR